MAILVGVDVKVCRRCDQEKLLEEFYVQKGGLYGRQSLCKVCERARVNAHPNRKLNNALSYQRNKGATDARHRKWQQENADRVRELQRLWWRRHPEFNRERQRLRKLRPVDPVGLRQRWAYYGDKCWICRVPATATDHVKPRSKGGGNLLCNLRPICGLCNSRKGNTWPFSKAALIGWSRTSMSA